MASHNVPRRWSSMETMVAEENSEDRSGQIQLGVSLRGMNCHGFVPSTREPETLLDNALALVRFLSAGLIPSPKDKVQILNNIDALVLPGEMLLVLGRPGAGCSTFLKSVAGDTPGFRIEDEQSLNYQGYQYGEFHKNLKGERVYVAELDAHFPELTLGDTLEFAVSVNYKNATSGSGRDAASLFGLTKAYDTQVGDEIIRGISGGEKRRTSIAEAYIGAAQLQLWDNSTRGLDALTALKFIRLLRETTDAQNSTVAMSLYQASEDMYACFDHVLLLYEGYEIYYGPTQSATDYFTRLGFVRPSRITTADFLTSITSPAERIVQYGYETHVPWLPEEFANVWRNSAEGKTLRAKIDRFNTLSSSKPYLSRFEDDLEKMGGKNKPSVHKATYPLSMALQLRFCLQRAFKRLQKNLAATISAVIANTILGVIIGSVFFNLSETTDSLDRRCLLLFFALMVNAFVPGIEVIVMWSQRPIVEKHHRYAFYHPFIERLSSIICDLPAKVIICFSIHLPIYFMANLRHSASAFFVYWLFMFANLVTMSMLFRMIGSVSRTREQTATPVSVAVLLFIIYTGFIVPSSYMKPWLAWVFRINPLAYTYESLVINEMRNRLFPCSTMIPTGDMYNAVSLAQKTCAAIGSTIGQQVVDGSTYIALRYDFFENHIWRNLGILLAMMVAFFIIHLLAAEYIAAQPSKGEVLRFRHQKKIRSRLPPAARLKRSKKDTDTKAKDDAHVRAGHGPVTISQQAGEFHWSNVNYEINGRQILSDVHGWVKPGALTALMGATGAGKTSLLNALANRTTSGKVSGEVYVDGQLRDASFQRKVGYVQQDDVHLATSTVREALEFSALLRQPAATPKAEKLAYVDTVLDLMDMMWYADAIIGVPGEGLNVEQRKRLTIAVEVVAKPELLLFLDEPTSGLDSQTAWSICTLLRKLADSGQTILCTIHQPSGQLFGMFDRLLLLGEGGRTLYFGDIGYDASTLVQYFESNGASRCYPDMNPAEWILNVTKQPPGGSMLGGSAVSQWSQTWNQSPEMQQVMYQLSGLNLRLQLPASPQSRGRADGRFAASLYQQMALVSKRILQDQWRDPVYLFSKILLSVCLSLVNGISFYNSSLDVQGVTNLLFSIFLITQLFSCVDQLVIPHFSNGQSLFEARDRNSNTYSWVVFIAANVLIELLWQTVIAVPIFAAWYYPTGLQHNGDSMFGTVERGALAFVLIWLFNLWASTISQAFAAAISNTEVAMQMATLFYWLALVFCGILSPPDQLPGFWIFMYRVSPLTYFLEGLAMAGLANTKISCSSADALLIQIPSGSSTSTTCGEYLAPFIQQAGGQVLNPSNTTECQYCEYAEVNSLLRNFGMDPSHAWRNAGLMAAYVCFNILLTFGLYWLARVPKRSNRGS